MVDQNDLATPFDDLARGQRGRRGGCVRIGHVHRRFAARPATTAAAAAARHRRHVARIERNATAEVHTAHAARGISGVATIDCIAMSNEERVIRHGAVRVNSNRIKL